MGELKERQDELNAARMKIIDQEELMRLRDSQTKQLISERDYLHSELKKLDGAFKDLSKKFEEQTRLLTSVAAHKKNPAANIHNQSDDAMPRV
jgi:predicted nuclease with TOPRIM domain